MPAKSPAVAQRSADRIRSIGRSIRDRRKALKVTATTLAEAAGLSRATLHRVERGEASVTIGAYLNVTAALGLVLDVYLPTVAGEPPPVDVPARPALVQRIRVGDYPQLRRLAWHVPETTELTPAEALGLYERNWRHLDRTGLNADEVRLLEQLARGPGKGHLLV